MAIDFDKLRKNATAHPLPVANKVIPTKQNVPIPPQMPQATTHRATTSPRGETVVPTNSRKRYQESTRQGYQQALQDNAGARFHAGLMEGLRRLAEQAEGKHF